MRNIIFILILPLFLFSQEKNKEPKKIKVDGYSGATNYSVTKGRISGKIRTEKNKNPIEYASISLTNTTDNNIIEGTITDKKGKFLFEDVVTGEYKLTISFVGFTNKEIKFSTTKSNPNFNNDEIVLSTDNKLLSEITIEEQKAIYETKIDKIVYNAENDLNENENDATDVLRKAPLLSVDLEGNVSLRGSRNIKFLVNGKASSFFSSDVSSALQMIPADEIKSIEVITTPGSKYDGDGDAGIVNIITKRKKIDGYQATIKSSLGSKTARNGVNLKLGKNKWGLSINGGQFGSGFRKRDGLEDYIRLDWDDNDTNMLSKTGISKSSWDGYRGAINTFYDINRYNSISSSLATSGRNKPYNKTETSYYTVFNEETDTTISTIDKTDRTLDIEWTTDYTKKFKKNEGQELSLAYQIGGKINDGNTNIYESTISEGLLNQNDEKVIEETFQIDYIHPFGSRTKTTNTNKKNERKRGRRPKSSNISGGNKIEIGGKIINRNREIVYSEMEMDKYIFAEEFNYSQKVSSSYLSSEFSLPKGLGLKTGLRLENTRIKGNWENNSEDEFKKDYTNILPSIIISKSFSPMQSIKLSYNNRITRPSVKEINTNTDKTDSRNILIGNPNLEPTITEQYELSISSYGRMLQSSLQLYHKHSKNVIEALLEIDEVGNSISQYQNIGETKQTGFGFFGSINFNKISFRSGFNIYNYSGRDARFGYDEWTDPVILYNYNLGGNFSFAKHWKVEAFSFGRSPSQNIQGYVPSFSMMSIGIKRTFINKRGSIGIRIIEPFQENKEFRTALSGDDFTQESIRTIQFRSISISFKYTFGKLNFKSSSEKTNIKNDDVKEDSNDNY